MSRLLRRDLLAKLREGGPDAVRLAQAMMSAPGRITCAEVGHAAALLLRDVARQPKLSPVRSRARLQSGRSGYFLTDPSGERVEIRGFAVVFGCPSTPDDRSCGLQEVILPEACRPEQLANVMVTRDHDYSRPIPGDLELALTPSGIMFRLSNMPATDQTRALARDVESGARQQCSFTARRRGYVEAWAGVPTFITSEMTELREIAIVPRGYFGRTACWTASQSSSPGSHAVAKRIIWDLCAPQARWVRTSRHGVNVAS